MFVRQPTSLLIITAAALVLTLAACSPATPTAPPAPTSPTPIISVTPTLAPATATPKLVISLVTPTPEPTEPPTPTATATLTGTQPSAVVIPTSSRPLITGSSAADQTLRAILQDCWGVTDTRALDADRERDRNQFDCARNRLLALVKAYPNYGPGYRMLAWGYYYKDRDIPASTQAYRAAINAAKTVGDKVEESASRMRLGLLLMGSSRAQGCSELVQAATLDPQNGRAVTYYKSFACGAAKDASGKAVALPGVNVNLEELRGKILFKSDRDGGALSVYIMDADGKNQKRVANELVYDQVAQFESFSPDHTQVAVVRQEGYHRGIPDYDIWITDPSGGVGRPLRNRAADYDPAWSPTGLFDGLNRIAFVSTRGDIKHSDHQGDEIWLMKPDGDEPMRLTCHGPAFSKHPSRSPDSSHIVFYSNYTEKGNRQIFVMNVSILSGVGDPCEVGEALVNLSNNAFNDTDPVWIK